MADDPTETAAPTLGDLRKGQHQPPKPGVIKMRTPATAAPWERPITDDFYRSPSGEWVYRWSDERLVLKEVPTDGE